MVMGPDMLKPIRLVDWTLTVLPRPGGSPRRSAYVVFINGRRVAGQTENVIAKVTIRHEGDLPEVYRCNSGAVYLLAEADKRMSEILAANAKLAAQS